MTRVVSNVLHKAWPSYVGRRCFICYIYIKALRGIANYIPIFSTILGLNFDISAIFVGDEGAFIDKLIDSLIHINYNKYMSTNHLDQLPSPTSRFGV